MTLNNKGLNCAGPLTRIFSVNAVNIFSLPYDFSSMFPYDFLNIFSSFRVRVEYTIHIIYKIHVNDCVIAEALVTTVGY